MKNFVLCVVLALPAAALAERYKVPFYEQPTAADQLFLKQIQVISNEADRVELMNKFLQLFPGNAASGWVCEQIQIIHLGKKQYDQVIATGEKLLAIDPLDLDAISRSFQAAQAKNDPAVVEKWSQLQTQAAQKILALPEPQDPGKKEAWKQNKEAAESICYAVEYGAFKAAADNPDARGKVQALEAFITKYPNSPYLKNALSANLQASRQLGDSKKMVESAERILKVEPENEEALVLVAQLTLTNRAGAEKAVRYANKVLTVMRTKKKPDNYSDADWEKQKAYYTGNAYSVLGSAYMMTQEWAKADASLRQALPIMTSAGESLAAALFYLGWANYHMERYQDAGKFFSDCAQLQSQYQTQAWQNLSTMKRERRIP